MTEFYESRRKFLRHMTGVGLLGGFTGCTAVGVEVDILIENTGTQEERTEYSIHQEETVTEVQTVDLGAGEEYATSVQMERGEAVVVSKGELGFEATLMDYICRNPALQVDTGFGALGVGGECFEYN